MFTFYPSVFVITFRCFFNALLMFYRLNWVVGSQVRYIRKILMCVPCIL